MTVERTCIYVSIIGRIISTEFGRAGCLNTVRGNTGIMSRQQQKIGIGACGGLNTRTTETRPSFSAVDSYSSCSELAVPGCADRIEQDEQDEES